jgi:hypothetical protein
LRLAAGIVVVHRGALGLLQARGSPFELLSNSLAILGGISLLLGVWTPAAGIVVAASEVWIALSAPVDLITRILLASSALALAMLGPGAWSIDSHLFGRLRLTRPER